MVINYDRRNSVVELNCLNECKLCKFGHMSLQFLCVFCVKLMLCNLICKIWINLHLFNTSRQIQK